MQEKVDLSEGYWKQTNKQTNKQTTKKKKTLEETTRKA